MSLEAPSVSPEADDIRSNATAKTMRKQGVSCDACKFRKVKCDRRMKIEARASNEDPDNVACSICTAHGLRCTFTQSAPRRRRGKRIVALEQDQLDDQETALAQRSLQEEQNLRLEGRGGPVPVKDPEAPLFGYDHVFHEGESIVSQKIIEKNKAILTGLQDSKKHESSGGVQSEGPDNLSKQGLFGVRGLTRALLDACVRSYFKYAAPCQPILHAEVFSARYRLFFSLFEQYQGIPPTSASPSVGYDERPLSVLVILAVGTVGAGLLEAPIAEPGSPAKFRLQDRMALRFHDILQQSDLILRLRDEGADVIEASYIMSDPLFKVLGNDDANNTSARVLDWARLTEQTKTLPFSDPLRLSASSAEAVVRLIFKMGINRSPRPRKDTPPGDPRKWVTTGGAFLSERECFRRIRIFWSALMQDSFRSFGMRIPLQIHDDDYDLDLPRLIPRQDGFFTALIFQDSDREKSAALSALRIAEQHWRLDRRGNQDLRPNPLFAQAQTQPARFARFDAVHLEVMLRLAFIIRSVSMRFVSHRSQGRGVLFSDIERAVSCLTAWWEQLPEDVRWSTQIRPLVKAKEENAGASLSDTKYAMPVRNSIKALFLETLYHANVLSVWSAVRDYGIRFEMDKMETLQLLASQIGLDDTAEDAKAKQDLLRETLSSSQDPSPEIAARRKEAAQAKLNSLLLKSFVTAGRMARQAGELGLTRSSRLFINFFSGFANYGAAFAQKAASMTAESAPFDVPMGMHPSDFILHCVESYIFGLSKIDSSESVPEIVQGLEATLKESRKACARIRGRDLARDRAQSTYSSNDGSNSENTPSSARAHSSAAASPTSTVDSPYGRLQVDGKNRNLWQGDLLRFAQSDGRQSEQYAVGREAPSVLSHMDVDEVAKLALAAMPDVHTTSDQVPSSSSILAGNDSDAWPSSIQTQAPMFDATGNSKATPNGNVNTTSLYGPALDLDLETLTGMNTEWLNTYLQGHQGADNDPSQATQTQPYIVSSATADDGSTAFMAATAGLGESVAVPTQTTTSSVSPYGSLGGIESSPESFPGRQYKEMGSVPSYTFAQGTPAPPYSEGHTWPSPSGEPSYPSIAIRQGETPHAGNAFQGLSEAQWQSFASGNAFNWATSQWQGFAT